MSHKVTTNEVLGSLQTVRVGLVSSSTRYGRKAIDWEPFTATFVVTSGEKLVCAGKDLAAAVEAYNAE